MPRTMGTVRDRVLAVIESITGYAAGLRPSPWRASRNKPAKQECRCDATGELGDDEKRNVDGANARKSGAQGPRNRHCRIGERR
jgi:hypothetical protein